MTVLATIALAAVALFAWACLFKILPSCLLSLFRYKLWRQRDELALEIRRGEYERRETAERVLEEIECFIEGAPELSPLNIGLLYFSARGVVSVPEDRLVLRTLPVDERERLESRLDDFHRTVARHVLFGTPSGWFVTTVTLPTLPVIWFLRAVDQQSGPRRRLAVDAQERVSHGSLALLSVGHIDVGEGRHQPLSQYV